MASYLVTGASRGIGFEMLRQLSAKSDNTVVALVRNKEATESKVAAEIPGRSNIHVVAADLAAYDSLKASVPVVSALVNGRLDYIIANAGLISDWSSCKTWDSMASDPAALEKDMFDLMRVNFLGNIYLFQLYLDLIRAGSAKKIITISSGMADERLVREYEIALSPTYSISKAAMNMAIAKFHASYGQEGILFVGVCPGVVDTGHPFGTSEEEQAAAMDMFAKFQKYAPNFQAPASPEYSVEHVLKTIDSLSLEAGNGGACLPHLHHKGIATWL